MLGRRVSGIQYVRWIPKWSRRYVRPTGTGRTVGVFLAFQLSLKKNLDASDSVGARSIKIQVYSINNGGFLPDMILLTLCYFFFFFHLTCYSRRASTLPSCLRSLRGYPYLSPVHALQIIIAMQVLQHSYNSSTSQWLNFETIGEPH